MTLDTILGKLTTDNGTKATAYDAKVLVGASDGLNALAQTDLTQKEGLEAYVALTGDSASEPLQRLDLRKKGRFKGGQGDVLTYAHGNFSNLVEEISEEGQTSLAFNYCPMNDSSVKNTKTYNAARAVVGVARETIQKIQENPGVYFASEMEKESDEMKRYMLSHQDEFVSVELGLAEENGALAIGKYGANKFLVDSKKNIDSQLVEFIKIEVAKNAALDAKKLNIGRVLTAAEEAEVVKSFNTNQAKYVDVQLRNKLASGVAENAIGFLKARAEEAVRNASA